MLQEYSMTYKDSVPVKEEEKIAGNRNSRVNMDEVLKNVEIKTGIIIKEELNLPENFLETETVESRTTSEANAVLIEERNQLGKRKMRSACLPERCKLFCGKGLISEEKRAEIFNNFWKLPTHIEKWEYISRNIEVAETKTSALGTRRHNRQHRQYCLEIDGRLTRVCKHMFEATLVVSSALIDRALKKYKKKEVPKRTVESGCELEKCKLGCGSSISEKQRKAIFEDFWNLSHGDERSEYIERHIKLTMAENKAAAMCETIYLTRRYFLEIEGKRTRVCQKMFCATLGIKDQTVSNVVKKLNDKELQCGKGINQKGKFLQINLQEEAPDFFFVDTDAVLGDA